MTPHAVLLDDLEARLRSPDFERMAGALPEVRVVRDGPERLTLHEGTSAEWLVEVVPLPAAEAPDERPRLSVRGKDGGPAYADHSVDGVVMSLFGLLLRTRTSAA